MRLTTNELPELPLAAAWLRDDGTEIARTPEWTGGGADTAQYRCGPMRLVVETREHQPAIAVLSHMVLRELDTLMRRASLELADVRRALCASLRLVMGAPDLTSRSTADVLATAAAAANEENVSVAVIPPAKDYGVVGGDTVALVLKQLATNARRHDDAEDLRLSADAHGAFRLAWRGKGARGPIETSRHPDQRQRWGLGLVRLAADALGASVVPARQVDGGTAEAVFTPSAADCRFTLPLAAISDSGTVERATRAWDEETELTPGAPLNGQLEALWRRARAHAGSCVADGPFIARTGRHRTWLALTPRSTRDHARDLIAGIAHERALVGEGLDATRLVGTAAALNCLLGVPAELWMRHAVEEALPGACAVFGAPMVRIDGDGRSAPPPELLAFLSEQSGGGYVSLDVSGWEFIPNRAAPLIEEILAPEPTLA